jgi:hypothetical protein
MRRRTSKGWSGAFLFIAVLGFLGSGCGLIAGSETIGNEPLGEGGKAGSGGVGGVGGGNGGDGGSGNAGGAGGSGGGICAEVPAACSECLSCGPVEVVTFTQPETKFLSVTTTKGTGTIVPDPIFGCKKADGPERVYAVTYTAAPGMNPTAFLTASLKRLPTSFDSVLYAKKNCCAGPTEVCTDSTGGAAGAVFGGEVLSMPVASGETWYIFVDGVNPEDSGSYEIAMNLSYGWSCASDKFHIPIHLERGGSMTLKGTTDIQNETNGCGSIGWGWIGWGSSAVYALRWAPDVTGVDIKLKSTDTMVANDTLLYLRTTCETQGEFEGTPDSELACVDINNINTKTGETHSLTLAGEEQPVFLFSDVGKGQGGPFELTLTPK